MLKKEEFLLGILELTLEVKVNKKKSNQIIKFLAEEYNILPKDTINLINNPIEFIKEMDPSGIIVFAKQLKHVLGVDLDLSNHFSENELEEAHSYDARTYIHDFTLPFTFDNAIPVERNNESFMTFITLQEIKAFFESGILYYDYDIQRETTTIKNRQGKERRVPTIYEKNVDEISKDLVSEKLKPTTLIWNARVNSHHHTADGEFTYNEKNLKLTINSGTRLAILDGMHLINGALRALHVNPKLNFRFPLLITNYEIPVAQEFQFQLSKATPISKNRKIQLEKKNLSDNVVDLLNSETDSDLRNRIEVGDVHTNKGYNLVEYKVLSRYIDKYFSLNSSRDINKVSKFLKLFFNELIGIYVKDFVKNMPQSRDETLVVNGRLFPAYVKLAAKMYDEKIDIDNLEIILNKVDFNKSNPKWIELEVLNDKLNFAIVNTDEVLIDYFDNLEINI